MPAIASLAIVNHIDMRLATILVPVLIAVHDINFRVDVQGCLDVYNFCSGPTEPVVVSLTLEYYIQGQLMGSATWEHFGPYNCHSVVWQPSFSNLSYSRSEINTLETKLTIGGTPFCQNSTTVTVYALEALCVAGEVHGGGCHCEPEG
jgi:hypothetical protein